MTQAIERIILVTPRAGLAPTQVAAVAELGRTMLSAIPGVEVVSFGTAVAADEHYQWYVRIRFRDVLALQAFDTHPNHLQFVSEHWAPLLTDHRVGDYLLQY